MSSLEEVWTYREESLYPNMFGTISRGIFPLEFGMFEDVFGEDDVDPRWLFHGVFEFQPTTGRSSWLYVTSGGSTPWETGPSDYRSDQYSGLGAEFVLEVSEQADWPIVALQRLLAYHLLASHRRLGHSGAIDYGHRIPAGGPINGSKSSEISIYAITRAAHYESSAQLESGRFDFLHVVGISELERDFAKATSTEELMVKLAQHGACPVTDPRRPSIPL